MSRYFRSGPAAAPRIEWFNKNDVWLDHRHHRIGIENPDDGVITWYASDLTIVEITDALDQEMWDLVEAAAKG
jgi:hypothetical protein